MGPVRCFCVVIFYFGFSFSAEVGRQTSFLGEVSSSLFNIHAYMECGAIQNTPAGALAGKTSGLSHLLFLCLPCVLPAELIS